jgi:HPt (histidine-containing phosphotransfer) domain-containing protein
MSEPLLPRPRLHPAVRQGWLRSFTRRLDAFLPATADAELQRRARISLGFAAVAAALVTVLAPVNLVVARPQAASVTLALLLALLPIPLLIRRYAAVDSAGLLLNGAILLVIQVAADIRGGLQSTTLGWAPVCVVIAVLTLSPRGAVGMTLVWAACHFVHALRVDPANWNTARLGAPLLYAIPRALACVTTLGLASIFESARKQAFARLSAEQEEIRKQRDEIASINQRLAFRNQDLRLVLDTIEQGLVTLDKNALIGAEYSRVVGEWFGPIGPGESFSGLLRRCDPRAADNFAGNWSNLMDDLLPRELLLAQLSTRVACGERTLQLDVKPLAAKSLERGVLVVISDITLMLEQAKADVTQRETLAIFTRTLHDRRGVRAFFAEAQLLVDHIATDELRPETLRDLHTFKGNAGMFGLERLARLAHELEDHLAAGGALSCEPREQLLQTWSVLRAQAAQWLGDGDTTLDVARSEFEALRRAVAAGDPHAELGDRLLRWTHEDARLRLEHLRERALRLAAQLGKSNVRVDVCSNGVRLDAARWGPFWNAFVHVVSNAVDHGLESSAERESHGKPALATLRLELEQTKDEVRLRSRDDGRGIDWDALSRKAAARGIVSSGVELLFEPGLSSREQASQTSGRGVGMWAVKDAADALGARISVKSEPGRFTEFEFRVPIDEPHRAETSP